MTTQEETPEVEASEEKPVSEGKGLRAQNDELRAKLRAAEARERDVILKDLQLDPAAGIGLVLTEQYDKGDLPLADIAAASVKYGHVVPDAQPAAHPQAQQINEGQAQLDAIGETAGSVAPPAPKDALAKAEADGDYATTMAIKGQQMADMLKPNRR